MKKLILLILLLSSVFVSAEFELKVNDKKNDVSKTVLDFVFLEDNRNNITFDVHNTITQLQNSVINRVKFNNVGDSDDTFWNASSSTQRCNISQNTMPYENSGMTTYRFHLVDADNEYGKTDSLDTTYDGKSTVSVGDEAKVELNVYPNPAQNEIMVSTNSENGMFTMFDALGQKVIAVNMRGLTMIDVTSLNNGVYFYSFVSENGVVTKSKRLVIRK